jgi:stress response protein SCP2
MPTVTGPAKGVSATLSLEGAGRLLVGLSWEPKESGPKPKSTVPALRDAQGHYDNFYLFKLPVYLLRTLFDAVFHLHRAAAAPDPHDLDLFCYVFDPSMTLTHVIGPKNAELIDPSRKVYHSGENQTGKTASDAEQIFVETRGLPRDYHTFIFVVKSANSYTLGDIPDAAVRLADSATNTNRLQNTIAAKAMPPGNTYGYVFCSMFREGDGWAVRNLDSFAGRAVDWNLLLPALEVA